MPSPILQPGHNVWRIEHAKRARVLIDGAAFFKAVREACLQAKKRIIIVGWDIDSRTQLIGNDEQVEDGYPTRFSDFLTELVKRRPELQIHLLLWDYSLLYAAEREPLPRLSLDWQMPEQVTLCLDSAVPFGSSQHQKIVVIDDAVAFSGGLDITIRRWDTSAHDFENPLRVDPAGEPYKPFHDIQMMVDGDAAKALAELARTRWCRVNGGEPSVAPFGDPWPKSCKPDFTNVRIGIARTQVRYGKQKAVREVEKLFVDSIDRAERTIYIENQFCTAPVIARRLARQLKKKPKLEVVIVAPNAPESWVEKHTMRNGRIRFWRTLKRAGGDRVRLMHPSVEKVGGQTGDKVDTMIHSKIMIIDDKFLRVGSANLNNRSMGADTECDLVVEASNDRERRAIVGMRDRLLGEHCGVEAKEVAAALADHGSMVRVADTLTANGHRLLPIDDGKPDRNRFSGLVEELADPHHPLRFRRIASRVLSGSWSRGSLVAVGVAFLVLALTLAWKFTDLSDIASLDNVRETLASTATGPWQPLVVLAAFVAASLIAFPVTILILASAAAFGPWLGATYSVLEVVISGVLTYWIGSRFQETLGSMLGSRWQLARSKLRNRGVLAVFAIRVVPVAPFTLINLAAGASSIKLLDFLVGTLLGMGPGLIVMSVMGDRIVTLLTDPTAGQVAIFAVCVVGWIAISFGAQALVTRLGSRAS